MSTDHPDEIGVEKFRELVNGCVKAVLDQGYESLSWDEWSGLLEAELEGCNPSGVEVHEFMMALGFEADPEETTP